MNGFEIERKFLISKLPDNLESYHHDEIEQGYFVLEEDVEERIRHRGSKYYHTKKVGHGEVREEYESEITKEEFNSIWPKTEGKRVYKTRYEIPYNKHTIELDIYHKNLEGLIVCEIEFNDKEESKNFKFPERFGKEITNENLFKNRNLIFSTFDKIKEYIK